VDGKDLRDAFYNALEAAGLGRLREQETPIVFHDLRHTFGTLAVRVFPLSDVKEMMGHADLQTTMRYVHYVPRHDAGRRLSQAFAVEAGAGELVDAVA
jgi:integrase